MNKDFPVMYVKSSELMPARAKLSVPLRTRGNCAL